MTHSDFNESHDSQDAYNPQTLRYTGYGNAARQQQAVPAQGQPSLYGQFPPYTPPNGAPYPPYPQARSNEQYPAPYAPYAPTIPQAPVLAKKPQANKTPKRSKAESLALLSRLKKWIIATSMVAFGTLSLLVAGHVTGVTSQSTTTSSTNTSTSTSNNSGGSYFQQGEGSSQSNSTSQAGNGGYGIGSSSSQGAVSSTRTS